MGQYTVKQVLLMTNAFHKTRFINSSKDISRVCNLTVFSTENGGMVPLSFKEAATLSQEKGSYLITADVRASYEKENLGGRTRVMGKHILCSYKLEFVTDYLSLNTTNWKIRLGEIADWSNNVPEEQLLHPYKNSKIDRGKLVREKLYRDKDDFNSKARGINGDFYFRCMYPYWVYGHLLGELPPKLQKVHQEQEQRQDVLPKMFFPKHIISFFELLFRSRIMQDTVINSTINP